MIIEKNGASVPGEFIESEFSIYLPIIFIFPVHGKLNVIPAGSLAKVEKKQGRHVWTGGDHSFRAGGCVRLLYCS
jgi:hypothetical protein